MRRQNHLFLVLWPHPIPRTGSQVSEAAICSVELIILPVARKIEEIISYERVPASLCVRRPLVCMIGMPGLRVFSPLAASACFHSVSRNPCRGGFTRPCPFFGSPFYPSKMVGNPL